jgi:hypothetical protein
MALAQIIQGSSDELIAFLKNRKSQENLTLIVPEERAAEITRTSYPEGATLRNGVPLFPTEGRTQAVTLERVKQLMEEEE